MVDSYIWFYSFGIVVILRADLLRWMCLGIKRFLVDSEIMRNMLLSSLSFLCWSRCLEDSSSSLALMIHCLKLLLPAQSCPIRMQSNNEIIVKIYLKLSFLIETLLAAKMMFVVHSGISL